MEHPVPTAPRRGPARAVLAAVAALTLALPLAAATSASAAEVVFPAGPADGSITWTYGSSQPASRLITIGAQTTEITIVHPIRVTASGITCTLWNPAGGPSTFRTWTRAEWQAEEVHSLPVPAGIVEAGSFALYRMQCRSGVERSQIAAWALKESRTAPEVLALTDDPAKITRYTEFTERRGGTTTPPSTLRPGDRFVVRGEAGAFARSGQDPAVQASLQPITIDGAPTAPAFVVTGAEVSADGSELSFTAPGDLPATHVGERVVVRTASVVRQPFTDTTPTVERDVRFNVIVRVESAPAVTPTSTRLALARSVGFTFSSVTATVAVTPAAAGGTVDLVVDGTVVATKPVPATGRVPFTLPRLPRGPHEVVARFSGTPTSAASESEPQSLRILF
ncbi:Ig-like domain-containing protein [Diaminobutyricimonas aerilata]|uniref:Ig-like domain-containing protein n=1 Tax=Diaminobutyricimonas aerilata TaxID=1162967 RepID=A0A2M9CIF3_9MICO|nr:Ig-like domain-containing protein [Diaminobutyricimonas aerilata]PJJ71668.1 Ig-like domain-containing protein [Diaminobutyricimonas aerilata]